MKPKERRKKCPHDHDDVNDDAGHDEEVNEEFMDRGWGWVVVIACTCIGVISGGMERSKGIMYVIVVNQFGTSAAETAYIFALVSTMRLCGGPLVGLLLRKVSCRVLIIVGAFLSFLGSWLTMFAPNIGFMFFSYGFLRGSGALLTYVPSIIILSSYFDKRLGLATGIATAGIGIGSMALPPLIDFLSITYDFRGLFLVIAAFFLNGIPLALLLRPVALQLNIMKLDKDRRALKQIKKRLEEQQGMLKNSRDMEKGASMNLESEIDKKEDVENGDDGPIGDDGDAGEVETLDCYRCHNDGKVFKRRWEIEDDQERYLGLSRGSLRQVDDCIIEEMHQYRRKRCREDDADEAEVSSDVDDNNAVTAKIARKLVFNKSRKLRPGISIRRAKKKICHFYLLKEPVFFLFCLALTFATMSLHTAMTFLPSLMTHRGISQTEAASTVAVMGATDTVSRLLFGYCFDLPFVKRYRLFVFNAVLFALSLTGLFTVYVHGFAQFTVISAFHGIMLAGITTPKSLILVDILSAELLHFSFGILLLFQGFGTITGSPLAGALYDAYHDYNIIFYFSAGISLVSGVLFLIGNILFRKHARVLAE